MPRHRGPIRMGTSGDLWTILSLAYNYADYDDVLRGLQVCKRLRNDLPKTSTRIQASNMTQVALEFMAKTFVSLEQLVIVQGLLRRPCGESAEDDDDDEDDDESQYGMEEDDYEIEQWHPHKLDFSKTRFPKLRKLAIWKSPLASLAFNTRNTPALTHLRILDTEPRPGMPNCVKLALPSLRQLHLEGVYLASTAGLVKSLNDCHQLELITLRRPAGCGNYSRVLDLRLPNCQRLEITRCRILGLRLWAPKIRRLVILHNSFTQTIDIEPREGPSVAVDIEGTLVSPAQLQEHPRVGRARVLGIDKWHWPWPWAQLPAGQALQRRALRREHPCETPWMPEGWDLRLRSATAYRRCFTEEEQGSEDEEGEEEGEEDESEEANGWREGYEGGIGNPDMGGYDYDDYDEEEENEEEEEDPVRRQLFATFMTMASPAAAPPKRPPGASTASARGQTQGGSTHAGAVADRSTQGPAAGGEPAHSNGQAAAREQPRPSSLQQRQQQPGSGVPAAGAGGRAGVGIGATVAAALNDAGMPPVPELLTGLAAPEHPLSVITGMTMQPGWEPSDEAVLGALASVVHMGATTAAYRSMLARMVMCRRRQRQVEVEGRAPVGVEELGPIALPLQAHIEQAMADAVAVMGQARHLIALGGQEQQLQLLRQQQQQILQQVQQLQQRHNQHQQVRQ